MSTFMVTLHRAGLGMPWGRGRACSPAVATPSASRLANSMGAPRKGLGQRGKLPDGSLRLRSERSDGSNRAGQGKARGSWLPWVNGLCLLCRLTIAEWTERQRAMEDELKDPRTPFECVSLPYLACPSSLALPPTSSSAHSCADHCPWRWARPDTSCPALYVSQSLADQESPASSLVFWEQQGCSRWVCIPTIVDSDLLLGKFWAMRPLLNHAGSQDPFAASNGGLRNLGINAMGLALCAALFIKDYSAAEQRVEKRKKVRHSRVSVQCRSPITSCLSYTMRR